LTAYQSPRPACLLVRRFHEVDGAELHGLNRVAQIAVAAHHDRRQGCAGRRKLRLNRGTAEPGHAQVQEQAAVARLRPREKFLAAGVDPGRAALAGRKLARRRAHVGVVVDDVDHGRQGKSARRGIRSKIVT
jgi:hypothetical protein